MSGSIRLESGIKILQQNQVYNHMKNTSSVKIAIDPGRKNDEALHKLTQKGTPFSTSRNYLDTRY